MSASMSDLGWAAIRNNMNLKLWKIPTRILLLISNSSQSIYASNNSKVLWSNLFKQRLNHVVGYLTFLMVSIFSYPEAGWRWRFPRVDSSHSHQEPPCTHCTVHLTGDHSVNTSARNCWLYESVKLQENITLPLTYQLTHVIT